MDERLSETLVGNITKKRKQLRLKISDLARKSGVSDKTLRKILDGTTQNPTIMNVARLAETLDATTSELIGERDLISDDEKKLINKYRKLNTFGKQAIREYMDFYLDYQKRNRVVLKQIPVFTQRVSAGIGNYLDSSNYDYITVFAEDVRGNNGFALQVSGDSMEPLLSDRDYIYVEPADDILDGEIGIFILNGDSLIKKYEDGQLVSLNEVYPPIDLDEADNIKIVGKYIKKLDTRDDF